jgi:hypothetical protein
MYQEQAVMYSQQGSNLMYSMGEQLSVSSWQSPKCAWCLCEQSFALGYGSHGIFHRYATEFLSRHRQCRMQ